MAASDVYVTIKMDSDLGKLIAEMAEEVKRQREQIAELRDGLDAWAGRIQALEAAQMTPESLARQIRMSTGGRGF